MKVASFECVSIHLKDAVEPLYNSPLNWDDTKLGIIEGWLLLSSSIQSKTAFWKVHKVAVIGKELLLRDDCSTVFATFFFSILLLLHTRRIGLEEFLMILGKACTINRIID